MKTLEEIKSGTVLNFQLWRHGNEHIFAKTESGETVVFGGTSLADDKVKIPISWYSHDIFNDGVPMCGILRKRTRTQYPWGKITTYRVIVPNETLYNQTKLSELYESEEFKAKRFAFFRYDVVAKLLGKKTKGSIKRMSGLFGGAK